MNALTELLASKEVLIADGATGTNLFEMGLANGACGELWCVEYPERVQALHQSFVDAGADIILTNSFSANGLRLKLHGLEDRVGELAGAAARLARQVADRTARTVVVAGSMGPTGEIIEPHGECTQVEAREAFEQQAAALAAGGVDVAWIETMYSEEELGAAIQAVDAAGLAYVATMTFDTAGHTMMGLTPEEAVRNVKQHGSRPIAFGANCGMGPAQLIASLLGLAQGAEPGDVLVAKGNAGLPRMGDDMHVHYDGTPEVMADYACLARDAGARIIGGCCGTTAEHLRTMVQALHDRPRDAAPGYDTIEELLGPVQVVSGKKPRRRPRRRAG